MQRVAALPGDRELLGAERGTDRGGARRQHRWHVPKESVTNPLAQPFGCTKEASCVDEMVGALGDVCEEVQILHNHPIHAQVPTDLQTLPQVTDSLRESTEIACDVAQIPQGYCHSRRRFRCSPQP